MLKRCLSGILALVLTLGLFVTIPQEANAATVLTSSAALVDVLKSMEGYSSKPFWDYAQWTVGYGTKCPDDKLDEYKKNGITKAEAQALLEKELTKAETAINKFTATYGLTLKQNEFDALVSFTYNCGTGWTKESDGYFNTAVRNGDKSNALLYGMLLWSTAGGEYILINRRMCEANIYINGEYRAPNAGGTLYPDNFRWVFLDGNGGDTYYKIYAFDSDNPQPINAALRSTPTGTDKDGNTFSYTLAGWYTAEGQEVTVLDDTITRGQHLYAKWKDPEGNILNPVATQPANPVQVVVTGDNVNIRSGPGTNYSILGTAKKNTVLTITDTYKSSNYTWGQFSDGWISLSYTNYDKTPIILRQPDSVTAAEGGIVQVTLDVAGANLSYQWYVASANSDKFYKSSITDSVYTTKMSSSRNGRQVYCVITGNNGISVQSETVTLHMEEMLAITKQPTDVAVSIGSTAKVQVTATGKGLSYQWYYRDLNADTFQKSSVKKATYSVKMSSARHGRSLYCEVTDQNGSKVRSEIVTISSTTALITKEPESAAAANGEKVSVKVEAAGTGLTYQWYVCSPNGTKFSKSSIKTDIYCTRMDESRDGRQVYCVITDADGNTVKSKTVSITIDSNLYIIQHPASVMATNGQIVNLSVKASGKGLTYQWYFCNAGKTKFSMSSLKTDTYCTRMDESRDGRQIYCVITDTYGNTVTSETVTISMLPENKEATALMETTASTQSI